MSNIDYYKDPEAITDFVFNWSDELEDGETITLASITIEPTGELQVEDSSIIGQTVVVWLKNGVANNGYAVICHIETSRAPYKNDDTIRILVQQNLV